MLTDQRAPLPPETSAAALHVLLAGFCPRQYGDDALAVLGRFELPLAEWLELALRGRDRKMSAVLTDFGQEIAELTGS